MWFTRKIASIYVIVFSLCIAPGAYALEVYVNNTLHKNYTDAELVARTYTIGLSGERKRGISLLEVMPLMSDAYRLEVISPDGTEAWTDGNMAVPASRGSFAAGTWCGPGAPGA